MTYHKRKYDKASRAKFVQRFIDAHESDGALMHEFMLDYGLPDDFRHWVAADGRWKPQPWVRSVAARRRVR